jgi:hypothetical protein
VNFRNSNIFKFENITILYITYIFKLPSLYFHIINRFPHIHSRSYWRHDMRSALWEMIILSYFQINFVSMALQPFGPWPLFQFLNPIHSRKDSLDGGSARRKAATYTQNNTNRINAHRHSCLEWDSNSQTTPVFERAKTVHALDGAANVMALFPNRTG